MAENSKTRVIENTNFTIRGHLLRWYDTSIQISNISTVSTADLPLPQFPTWTIIVAAIGIFLLTLGSSWSYYDDDLTREQIVGILLLVAAVAWIVRWSNIRANMKGKESPLAQYWFIAY